MSPNARVPSAIRAVLAACSTLACSRTWTISCSALAGLVGSITMILPGKYS